MIRKESLDLADVAAHALPLIEEAGARLVAGHVGAVARKSDGSLVTAADVEADRLLSDGLRASFPEVAILSEERRHDYAGEGWCWVLDPIDGTGNFAAGLPVWAISLALLSEGVPALGLLHFPLLRETYAAIQGRGATCNGRPLRVDPAPAGIPLVSICSRSYARAYLAPPYKPRMFGCTTYTFAAVASGAVVGGSDLGVRMWDVVVGDLLVREAGGVVRYPGGESPFPLRSGVDYSAVSLDCLCAASEDVADAIVARTAPR